jgi:hypothetical protein
MYHVRRDSSAQETGPLKNTVFTRLSAAALFKFSEFQMRRSFGGGAQSGAALFKKYFICEL